MGGSSYNIGVGTASRGRSYSDDADEIYRNVKNADPSVLPTGDRTIWTDAMNPIVIALDVTGSMGNAAKIMFDKIPMFWGQMEQKGYLQDPAISFAAIGDVYCDQAPLQITQFEKAKAIHPWLQKIWLEGGGGGQTRESYDLAALFYVEKCRIPETKEAFFFFIGDEGFYSELDGHPTLPIFEALLVKFNTYFIHWPYQDDHDDKRIVEDWKEIMGERFMVLRDPKAIVDVMLGLIAMHMKVRDLDGYAYDLKDRGQTDERVDEVIDVLKKVNPQNLPEKRGAMAAQLLPNRDPFRTRRAD